MPAHSHGHPGLANPSSRVPFVWCHWCFLVEHQVTQVPADSTGEANGKATIALGRDSECPFVPLMWNETDPGCPPPTLDQGEGIFQINSRKPRPRCHVDPLQDRTAGMAAAHWSCHLSKVYGSVIHQDLSWIFFFFCFSAFRWINWMEILWDSLFLYIFFFFYFK